MKNPPTKREVASEFPLILSNSLILVVMSVMLRMPMYPINKHIKLEIKARRNHKPNGKRSSELTIPSSSTKIISTHCKYNSYIVYYSAITSIQQAKWPLLSLDRL
jgi:hypothetical protein